MPDAEGLALDTYKRSSDCGESAVNVNKNWTQLTVTYVRMLKGIHSENIQRRNLRPSDRNIVETAIRIQVAISLNPPVQGGIAREPYKRWSVYGKRLKYRSGAWHAGFGKGCRKVQKRQDVEVKQSLASTFCDVPLWSP
jgi:hypothetical protein